MTPWAASGRILWSAGENTQQAQLNQCRWFMGMLKPIYLEVKLV